MRLVDAVLLTKQVKSCAAKNQHGADTHPYDHGMIVNVVGGADQKDRQDEVTHYAQQSAASQLIVGSAAVLVVES